MVGLAPFAVERWMDDHETWAKYNLAETCSASISMSDLISLSQGKPVSSPSDKGMSNDGTNLTNINGGTPIIDFSRKLLYGSIRGSNELRQAIAKNFYNNAITYENILLTPGAISANFLALFTLVGKGDHVVCQYPTYQQLYAVPESLGAEVSLWKSKEDKGWELDLDELKAILKNETKLVILNNPQNPTGAVLDQSTLETIVSIITAHDPSIIIMTDEVYRPLYHSSPPTTTPVNIPSILSLPNNPHKNSISTGSMSKAFSLAGIRLGWIASNNTELIEQFASSRDYTNISVSQVDDQIARFAMGDAVFGRLVARNVDLASTNLTILENALAEVNKAMGGEYCRWVKPRGGTTLFVKFTNPETAGGKPIDGARMCQALQEKEGVMFVPGSECFGGGVDFKGYVRIGYVCETEELERGLERFKVWMKEDFLRISTV